MMKRCLLLALMWTSVTFVVAAHSDVRQLLDSLFNDAERCYVIDDYQQLQHDINRFADLYAESFGLLGDDQEMYQAYYYKMNGAFHYGLSEGHDSEFNTAEKYYLRSLAIMEQRRSTNNIMTLHEELAQLYYKAGLYLNASIELGLLLRHYYERVFDMGIGSDEGKYYLVMSQLAISNARQHLFPIAIKQINDALNYFKRQKTSDYYETLRKKAKILIMQTYAEGKDNYPEAIRCYRQYVNEQYTAIGSRLSAMTTEQRGQFWLAIHQFLYDCCRLGNKAPDMLYDLALFSKDYLMRFEQNHRADRVEWKHVQRELGKRDCALEFLQYYGPDDQKRMGCLVLKSNGKPVFVDLFATDSLMSIPISRTKNVGQAITSTLSLDKDTLYNNKSLPALVWSERLMQEIASADRIFFAPDGCLHQLAIEYMMPDSTKTCYRLSSTRNIQRKRPSPRLSSALLCGGMIYNMSLAPDAKDNDVEAYRYLAAHSGTIKQLPGTRREVDSIRAIRHCPKDTLLTAEKATDENFTSLLKQKYDVVHLATHGFFSGKTGISTDVKPLLNDNSMSRSGILFSGVSSTIANKYFDEQLFDGVLSATELAKQDFSNTEMVVMSACQTGMGHLTADGIYGIQRALKQAGAHAIILSLWSVSDNTTQRLMRFFYEELERQPAKNIHAAFMKARKRLMNEQQTVIRINPNSFAMRTEKVVYSNPKYANPFILIDTY